MSTQLTATADNMVIWSIARDGQPLACHGVLRVGTSEEGYKRLASQAAERSAYDYIVTCGMDPADPRFAVMAAFRAGTSAPYSPPELEGARKILLGFKKSFEKLTEMKTAEQ